LLPHLFLAGFTNVGPQIKVTAPGVGIVSTVPGGYTPMSGTSMAAPMITGLAAALLSSQPDLLGWAGQARVAELSKLIYDQCLVLGLGRDNEGYGLPLPNGEWRRSLAATAAQA
jgi:subtilisin